MEQMKEPRHDSARNKELDLNKKENFYTTVFVAKNQNISPFFKKQEHWNIPTILK